MKIKLIKILPLIALAFLSSCKDSGDTASSETKTPPVEAKRIITVLQSDG